MSKLASLTSISGKETLHLSAVEREERPLGGDGHLLENVVPIIMVTIEEGGFFYPTLVQMSKLMWPHIHQHNMIRFITHIR